MNEERQLFEGSWETEKSGILEQLKQNTKEHERIIEQNSKEHQEIMGKINNDVLNRLEKIECIYVKDVIVLKTKFSILGVILLILTPPILVNLGILIKAGIKALISKG